MKTTVGIGVKRINWRLWTAAVVALASASPASAFYWYDWPGSRIPSTPTLIPPGAQSTSGNPPGSSAPVRTPTPPGGPPVNIDKPPVGPSQTPEPSTGIIGLVGLGTLAAIKRLKHRRN